MFRTRTQFFIFAAFVGFLALPAADTAEAGFGWLHGRHHGLHCCSSAYGYWGAGYTGYGYIDPGYDSYGYGGYGFGGSAYSIPGYSGLGYPGYGYGGLGYRGLAYGAVYGSEYRGAGYYRPRYDTRWDAPQNWGWSNGLSGHHIWGHWYQDGGIWGVAPVSAAIRAYGPSRYYPTYEYGAPGYGGASIYHGAQAERPAASSPAVPTPSESQVAMPQDSGKALLTVAVPEEARVFVNGRQTTSRGSIRKFESAGLRPGLGYAYEVRAEVERNGEWVSDVQKVDMRAGEARDLVFDFGVSKVPETSLTLHVPADAQVELAGAMTTTTGTVRTFATTGLEAGQGVPNYTVRVAVERFGRVLVKEQTIDLQAGRNTSLAFDFDENQLAEAVR